MEIKDLRMIAVAGTHGKTNTTAMVAWALEQADIPVSYSIGARIPFGPFGKYDESSKYFIYEADEFDRNFLQYSPAISIVTNIAFDHPDTYVDQIDYDSAFAHFINKSDSVYIYADDFNGAGDRIHVFGKDDDESTTKLAGKYIRQNARLVLEMLHGEFGIEYQAAANYLNNFPGTSRRMEKLSENLYSDYAHHPDEIRATIQMASEINDSVVAIYQPHQNIRQHEVMDSYTDCFEGTKNIYWLPTYLSRENEELDILTPDELIEGLTNRNIAHPADMNKDLLSAIKQHISEGSLVVGMSAGNLDHWLRSNFEKN
jgi:UDP-N-acetylmuramate--alanine ligase